MLDTLIRGARVIDGTGNSWFRADVGIEAGRISRLGALNGEAAQQVVDADDAVLAPGFIDIHTHSDFTLPRFPRCESMVAQGVTTQVTGNCGFSPFPVVSERLELLRRYTEFISGGLPWDWRSAAEYFDYIDALPLANNVVPLVGHGALRIAAMGFENRAPTGDELETMQRLAAESLEQGAFGLSSGLIYVPGTYAETPELIAMARVASRYGGFYATHLRSETEHLVAAVEEALTIGRDAGVPVELSHHKVMGQQNWGMVEHTLAMVDEARRDGLDVTLDQYPYTGSSTSIGAFLPTWSLEGGVDELLRRLDDEADRTRIKQQTEASKPMAWDKVVVAGMRLPHHRRFEGMTIEAIGRELGREPLEAALDLAQEEGGLFPIIRFGMSEDDVRTVMRHPQVMIASDGHALNATDDTMPHPRNYGTFARVLDTYVRGEGHLALEEAIRKMTSLPAQRLGLWDRGLVRPGCVADLVLLRPEAVKEEATFADPHRYASGVDRVWVSGIEVWREGRDTGAEAGKVLRRGPN
jgi:N-acyl-D-amino-acid deacylase